MPWDILCFRALIVVLLFASFSAGDDAAKQAAASQLLGHAASMQNIRAQGAKPFHLHLTVHAERVVAKPADGTYDEIWLGPDKWRREILFPGFSEVVVGDQDSSWVSRNLDFRPRLAYLVDSAVHWFIQPGPDPKESIVSMHDRKRNGTEGHCVEIGGISRTPYRELCFDQSGTLFSAEYQNQRFDYEGYSKFGDRLFPGNIHVSESGREILALRVDKLSDPEDARSEFFQHDIKALRLAPCERWPGSGELAKKVPPHYPEDARHAHVQGTVTFYSLLSADGRVQKLTVLESAGRSLDQAASEAVQQWLYEPVRCGSQPLPTEVEVRVNFALSSF